MEQKQKMVMELCGGREDEQFGKFIETYPLDRKPLVNFSFLKTINEKVVEGNIPIISMLIDNIGLYFWVLVLCFAYCIYIKKYENIVMLLPIIGLWITTIAAPMVDLRYIYPMFLTIPLYIGIIVKDSKKEN